MDQLLVSLITECLAKSTTLGITGSNTVVLSVGASDNESVNIYVSYIEPNLAELPLNFMWLVADQNSGNYRKLLKRVSRISTPPFNNTYIELSTRQEVLTNYMQYDQASLIRSALINHVVSTGNSHNATPTQLSSVNVGGDQMVGQLLARANWRTVPLVPTEFIPNQRLIDAQNAQTNGFYTIIMQLNSRVSKVEEELRNLKLGRIKELEDRVTLIEETGNGSIDIGIVPRTYVHIQETEQSIWTINHRLGNTDLIVQYWVAQLDGDGKTVYEVAVAESITLLDGEFLVVEHNMPVKGKVVILEAGLDPAPIN
jgi:hypothetical protein